MQLWKYSGIYLLLTGIVHNLVGFILGWDILLQIADDGLFNVIEPHYDRRAIFWFLFAGFSLMILGQLSRWIIKTYNTPLPRFLGWYLFVIALVGVFMIPVSGFWLLLPQGLIIIFSRKMDRYSNTV